VSIWFTEALEPKFSSIDVRDAKGVSMITGPAVLAAGNTAQLIAALKPLPPGTYKVIWKVVSVDTHRTQGEFVFTVGR
jgi:methionine-rich copper-binding protein CopC